MTFTNGAKSEKLAALSSGIDHERLQRMSRSRRLPRCRSVWSRSTLHAACILLLIVPTGYVSGSPLLGSATFANQPFNTLGVTPGIHEWTWGSGPNADSMSVVIPEPATLALLGPGLLAARRRRQ